MTTKFFALTSLVFTLTAFTSASNADVIRCINEDITVTYSFAQQSLTIKGDSNTPTVIPNVSIQIKGPGIFVLLDNDKTPLQTLNLNNHGTDGNSDRVYPYDGVWTQAGATKYKLTHEQMFSGCESNLLKATGGD